MSQRNFSNRRKSGMRYRPNRGLHRGPKSGQPNDTRMRGSGEADTERIFASSRHEEEIQKAENKWAGLPETVTDDALVASQEARAESGESDRTNPDTAAQSESSSGSGTGESGGTAPSETEEEQQGFVGGLRNRASKVFKRVQRFIKPSKQIENEIIINAESLETRVAILESSKLEEFNIERTGGKQIAGSIYKGKVKNLEDGLKAAFVDIGFEKNAFLHYWDIVPSNFDSGIEIVERGNRKREKKRITHKDIPKLYPPNSDITVQVTKGPIGTKGPRVTTNLSLPGRYLVLLPNSDQCGISRKIENTEERQRLKKVLKRLTIPEGMGVVMRTAGEGKQTRYFVRDLALLLEQWKQIQENINKFPAPACVFEEPDLIGRTVRDFLTEDVERIVVDDTQQYERIQDMVQRISKRSASKVKHYTESQPLFDRFNITRQLENAFSRQVHLKSGGYIVIDETEALVAIDVNTGRYKTDKDQESTILNVNLEAAEEIARQLRLRNIGGLIVLDFIDMKSRKDQIAVYQRLKDCLKRDKAKTHLLPISQLGLMEMTRQRHTESVHASVYVDCPYCQGRGVVKSALTMSVEIQRKLSSILKKRPRDESDFQLRINVHPTVLERLRTEDEKLLIDLEKRYFGKLSFRADSSLHAEQFRIFNVATNEELANVGGRRSGHRRSQDRGNRGPASDQ